MLRSHRNLLPFTALVATLLSAGAETASAQAPAPSEQTSPLNNSDRQTLPKSPKAISAEDQKSTLDFIAEHHPELSHLLEQLQKSRPDEFRSALRELVPQTQAIIRMRDRLPARYPTQLAAWKRDSQIRLLMARWSRSQDPQIETQVRELIAQRHKDRTTELQAEQQRLSEQLRKVEEQLKAQNADPQQVFNNEWEQLARRASAAARSAKAATPPKNRILSRPAKSQKPANPKPSPPDSSSPKYPAQS